MEINLAESQQLQSSDRQQIVQSNSNDGQQNNLKNNNVDFLNKLQISNIDSLNRQQQSGIQNSNASFFQRQTNRQQTNLTKSSGEFLNFNNIDQSQMIVGKERKKRQKKKLKTSQIVQFIFQTIFLTYSDQVTDVLMLIEFYDFIFNTLDTTNDDLQFFILVVMSLLFERYNQFLLNIKLLRKIDLAKQDVNEEHKCFSERTRLVLAFISALTYTEFIILYQVLVYKGTIEKYIRFQKLLEVMAENSILGLAAGFDIVYRMVNKYDMSYIPILSLVFTVMSSSLTFYQFIKQRIDKKFESYKGYYQYSFSQFQPQTQWFLLDPVNMPSLKIYFVDEDKAIKKDLQIRKMGYKRGSLLQAIIQSQGIKKVGLSIVYIFQNLYMYLYIFLTCFTMIAAFGIQVLNKEHLNSMLVMQQAQVMYIPIYILQLRHYLKNRSSFKFKFQDFPQIMKKVFIHIMYSSALFIFPIVNEHIPFIRSTYQKWIYQGIFPDEYLVLCRWILLYRIMSNHWEFMEKQDYSMRYYIENEENFYDAFKEDSMYYKLYTIVNYLFYIQTFFFILYLFDFVKQMVQVRLRNKENIKKQKTLQDNLQQSQQLQKQLQFQIQDSIKLDSNTCETDTPVMIDQLEDQECVPDVAPNIIINKYRTKAHSNITNQIDIS